MNFLHILHCQESSDSLHVLKLLGKVMANFKAYLRLTCAVQTSIRNEMQTLVTSKKISRTFYCVSWEAHIYLIHDKSRNSQLIPL